ncbi:vitamin B6 photo-protection and homoeostasis-domain-containing protein [Cunninghamella echinulata]|nr:vitamin B6 photo-protection and homoeostasis-domain-containing protein [Cunninghamella echinulata]
MFELIHESIWIASHMTFTKHFSPNGNIGDIVAKDDAQMSTAHLLGMLSGVGLISVSHSPLFLFSVFAILSPINIWTTVKMINAAQFEILNQAKVTLLSREFIDNGDVVNYDQLKKKEIGFGEWIKPGKSNNINVNIKMGRSAEEAYGSSDEIQSVIHVLQNENYLLNYHNNTMYIMFHDDANAKDSLKSILHAMKFHDQLTANNISKLSHLEDYISILDQTLDWTNNNFNFFVDALDKHNWVHDTVYWNDR